MQVRLNKEGAKPTARYFFDSLQEAQRWIEATPRTWREDASKSNKTSPDWDLNTDYTQALALARDGWREGAAKVTGALKRIPVRSAAPEIRHDFYGYRPNVARAISGRPDAMVRRANNAESNARPIVTLVVPINAGSGVRASSMSNFGIAVMHHVRQLEANKVRVEIVICTTTELHSDGTRLCTAIRVKRAEQPMNLGTLAFAIGHPAMFRRIIFAIRERTATESDSSYGFSVYTEPSDIVGYKPGTVIINGMRDADTVASTPAKALKYVEAKIEAAMKGGAKAA